MEVVEIVLWIVEIVAISVSILAGSMIAWRLYDRRWRLEKQERLVSDVLAPLIAEVDGNIGMVRNLRYGLSLERWEDIRNDSMWRYSTTPVLKEEVESLYSKFEGYESSHMRAVGHFEELLTGVFAEFVFGRGVLDNPREDAVKAGTFDLKREGFNMYLEEDWDVVREKFSEGIGECVRELSEVWTDAKVVSGEDVLTILGSRIEKDEAIEEFESVRLEILEDGKTVSGHLSEIEKWTLAELYEKVF